jgi:hypothetical protein
VPPAPSPEDARAAEEGKVAQVGIGEQQDVAAVAAVAAVRAALGNVLLAPEAERAVPAASAADLDPRPIVEHRRAV